MHRGNTKRIVKIWALDWAFAPAERYIYRIPMPPIPALQRSAMCIAACLCRSRFISRHRNVDFEKSTYNDSRGNINKPVVNNDRCSLHTTEGVNWVRE